MSRITSEKEKLRSSFRKTCLALMFTKLLLLQSSFFETQQARTEQTGWQAAGRGSGRRWNPAPSPSTFCSKAAGRRRRRTENSGDWQEGSSHPLSGGGTEEPHWGRQWCHITECLWEIKPVRTLLTITLSVWSNSVKKRGESFDQWDFFHC